MKQPDKRPIPPKVEAPKPDTLALWIITVIPLAIIIAVVIAAASYLP